MSQKANYFKLGLFVIGSIAALVVLLGTSAPVASSSGASRSKLISRNRCRAWTSVRS
jgi:hypothetical protein